MIYAGGGIISAGAAADLRAFVDRTGIPVALTLNGFGALPSEHFLCLHMLGMHGTIYANYAISEADLLLALGVRFDDRVTGKVSEFAKHGEIIHIDIDPSELNKNKAAHIPIVSDVGYALRELNKMLDKTENRAQPAPRSSTFAEWIQQIEKWREAEPLCYEESPMPSCPNMPSTACGRSFATANNWTRRS